MQSGASRPSRAGTGCGGRVHAENRTRSPSAAGAQGVPRSFGLANAVSQPISVQRLKPVPKLRLSDDESPFLAPPTLASVSARPRVSERGRRARRSLRRWDGASPAASGRGRAAWGGPERPAVPRVMVTLSPSGNAPTGLARGTSPR